MRYYLKVNGERFGHTIDPKHKDRVWKIAKYINAKTGKFVSIFSEQCEEYWNDFEKGKVKNGN